MSNLKSDETELDRVVKELSPMHPAQHDYYELKCAARWGKVARTLIVIGVVYNAVLLFIFVARYFHLK